MSRFVWMKCGFQDGVPRVELAKVLTPENPDEVLPRFFHLSKSGAKAVSAALRPAEAAPRRTVVTAVRPTAAAPAPAFAATEADHVPTLPAHGDVPAAALLVAGCAYRSPTPLKNV